MEALYASRYADLYRRHWWWRVRESILIARMRKLVGDRAGSVRILDVGCGAALFFDALSEFGHVEGIESDPAVAQQSGKWRGRVHTGDLETFPERDPFDVILMLDVLEHVANPQRLLGLAARRLHERGFVMITVPAFQSLWTSHDDLNHHVKRYTAADVRRLVKEAGLIPLEVRYLFQSLVVPKLLVRARETLQAPVPTVPEVPTALVNGALQAWFRSEHVAAGWLPFGTSVMAIARSHR